MLSKRLFSVGNFKHYSLDSLLKVGISQNCAGNTIKVRDAGSRLLSSRKIYTRDSGEMKMADSKVAFNFHPETKAFLEHAQKTTSFLERASKPSVDTFRKSLNSLMHLGRKYFEYDGKRDEIFVPSEEVKGGIPVYVYTPRTVPSEATIMIYFHGGGNVAGSRELVDSTCKILSSQAECIVVNVEFRLAPEHKFPAMFDDCVTVARWVLANRTSLGGTEKSKVGVSGDSTGGILTASVAYDAPGLAFQIPVYALLSGTTYDSPSFREFEPLPFLSSRALSRLESLVANKKEDLDNPRYHILGHKKYDHLPPTLLIVAEFDRFRDDSYEYSRRLTAAGVENEVFLAKGAIHGYYIFPGSFPELCRESYAKTVEFIKKFSSTAV